MYSPYWFYRAKSAQEADDISEAEKSFGSFNEVWRPVLRKDPYKVEALKFRIDGLVRAGLTPENTAEILRSLSDLKENIPIDDWANNIYAGTLYFTVGQKDKAVDCVMCNIDFNFETDTSKALLDKFQKETVTAKITKITEKTAEILKPKTETKEPDTASVAESVKDFGKNLTVMAKDGGSAAVEKLQEVGTAAKNLSKKTFLKLSNAELKKAAKNGDTDAQLQLAIAYEKRIKYHIDPDIILGVGFIGFLLFAIIGFFYMKFTTLLFRLFIYLLVCGAVASANTLRKRRNFNLALHWYETAAENGNAEAAYLCGRFYEKRYYFDLDSEKKAWKMYLKAAEYGHAEAQYFVGHTYESYSAKYDVKENPQEAVVWHKRAARQGHIKAQNALTRIYKKGAGYSWDGTEVKENKSEAYKWSYLTYLCKGSIPTTEPETLGLSSSQLKMLEAEAREMFETIQKRREQEK